MGIPRHAVRFRLGVDVNNVIVNSSGEAARILTERGGFSGDPISREEFNVRPFYLSEGIIRRGITKDQVLAAIDDTWRHHSSGIELMDPKIPEVISMLRSEGVRVEMITTAGARDHALRSNLPALFHERNVGYDDIHFVDTSEAKVAFPLHTIVDDEQQLAIDLAATGRPGLVYPAPWNAEFVTNHQNNPQRNPLVIPVENWEHVGKIVLGLATSLRE